MSGQRIFTSIQNLTPSVFYTSTKSWRGYIFTAVCLSVCVCVCPALLVNKIPAELINRFGRGFRLMVAYPTGSIPIERAKGLRFKVSFERRSPEIDLPIWSPMPTLTKPDIAQLDSLVS